MKRLLTILGTLILTTTSLTIMACSGAKQQIQSLPIQVSEWNENNGKVWRLLNINNAIYAETETSNGKGNLYKNNNNKFELVNN